MRFKDNKAIYLQIADLICDDILQGKLLEDERIPSVREYAATVEVNANTCARLLRISGRKDRHPTDETRGVHE